MFERSDLGVLKKEAKEGAKEMARLGAKISRERERQKALEAKRVKETAALAQKEAEKVKEAAALAKKEAEEAAKEKARQETEAVREREKQEALEAKKAKEAVALAKKEAEKAAKEKARQEAEETREKARQEAMQAKIAQESTARVKKEAEDAAKEKARLEAEAVREREKQEALEAKRAKEAAVLAQKEAEKAAKEKARLETEKTREKAKLEAMQAKIAQESAARAKKEAEDAAKEKARLEAEKTREKARQEAMQAKIAQESAARAKKEAEAAAKEKARLEVEKARQEAEAVRERAKHMAEEMKKAQEFAASPRREAEAVVETERTKKIQNTQEVASEGGRTKRRASFNAVPLFSGRSLLILCIGIIVGAGLGLVYWIVSPSLSSSNAPAGNVQPNLSQRIGIPSDVPWTSTVNIQVVNPGYDSMALSDLRARGQYYAAKATSLPFLQYLSQDLEKNTAYPHTPDELDQIIKVSFDSKAEQPTILITATANNIQESQFLATHIPKVFNDYLIAEENNTRDEQYQIISGKIDRVKASIVESQQELNKFTQANNKVESDPKYVALDAKIRALETELDRQATVLASQLVSGNDITKGNAQQQEYEKTLQQTSVVSAALSEAENKLRATESQKATTDNFSSSAAIVTLNAKISALQNELNRAMNGDGINPGLVHLIATGATGTTGYIDTQKQVDKISEVLVQTQNELATLQSQSGSITLENDPAYQLALANVDSLKDQQSALRQRLTSLALDGRLEDSQPSTQAAFEMTSAALAEAKKEMAALKDSQSGSDSLVENLDYQVALNKADNLNKQLATLTGQLSSMVGDTFNPADVTNYLAAGNPSMPLPVMPARMRVRNALMMGGIVGIGGAWAILNRKWLAKSMSNSSAKADEEEDLA